MSERPDARKESLEIPQSVRRIIDERDGRRCRVCGKYLGDSRAIHHIEFGLGTGVRRVHDPEKMITVCWMWAGNCHDMVHSFKHRWMPYLLEAARSPGVTAMQLRRRDMRRHDNALGVATHRSGWAERALSRRSSLGRGRRDRGGAAGPGVAGDQ